MASAVPSPPPPPSPGNNSSKGRAKGLLGRMRPIARTSVISSVLWSAGDILCQSLEQKRNKATTGGPAAGFDYRRQAAQASYGLCVIGPLSHVWYEKLDTFMLRAIPGGGARLIAAKVAADLAIFGPIHLAAFLAWTGIAAGEPIRKVADTMRREMLPALAADTAFWAPVQTINFALVPVPQQAVFVNLACVADAAFLSYIGNNPGAIGKLLHRLQRGGNEATTS